MPCTARPIAVPYRPLFHGGSSRSRALLGQTGIVGAARPRRRRRRRTHRGGAPAWWPTRSRAGSRGRGRGRTPPATRSGRARRTRSAPGVGATTAGARRCSARAGTVQCACSAASHNSSAWVQCGPIAGVAVAGLAVHRDDEVIAGPRARDVEQPQLLVEAHLLVDRLVQLEVDGLHALDDLDLVAARGREQHLDAPARGLGGRGHARAHDDRELEALGAVDRHDAHRVVVGLGNDRFHDPRAFGALHLRPRQVVAQRSADRVGVGAGLVDRNRTRRATSRKRPVSAPTSITDRSRTMRSSSSLGVDHTRAACSSPRNRSALDDRDRRPAVLRRTARRRSSAPPCSTLNRNRSSSPQPNTDDRNADTNASVLLESSTARNVIKQVAHLATAVDERAGLGAVRDAARRASACSRYPSDVRAGNRMHTSPRRAGRHSLRSLS